MSSTLENTLEFDGKCAFALSVGAVEKAPTSNPKYTVVRNGKTYGFLGALARVLFLVIPGSERRAQAAWANAQ
ncbi:hypothetical protein V1639_15225 [Pseudarthrobacter sp. J75]|uniref:hypothetical protein n=1 Tax=unclassified Pseudarthrobacter TaxID=2647000 RepID=UPI002E8160BE|nr:MULTISPECIES: hypothetical protein [unclassified Pseudarthrobacter]MEE2524093.1 hypothetical protein [Pseudarthrobacter sp. J47]MEE2530372.1 hypothetical protein [Pseudarthrobacter sp. J75]MEE2568856.1 hypothetical protein [Pseudarthrobacter sp. J64]